jgi:hypothetical protein
MLRRGPPRSVRRGTFRGPPSPNRSTPDAGLPGRPRHREGNVTEHVPEGERPVLLRRLRAAWALPDADPAAPFRASRQA